MRVAFVALLLAACFAVSETQAQREAGALRPLTPAELRTALRGNVLCRGMPTEMCEGVLVPISVTDTEIRAEYIGVMAVEEFSQGPFYEFFRAEPWFAEYQALFAELEAHRVAAGGHGYVKTVEVGRGLYDPANGAWCPPEESDWTLLRHARIYFSPASNTQQSGDVAFPEGVTPQLDELIRRILTSPSLQARIADNPEMILMKQTMLGEVTTCSIYYGVVRNGRPEVRAVAVVTRDGRPLPWLNEPARVAPARQVLAIDPR